MPINSQFTVATHILTLLTVKDTPLTSRQISISLNTNPVVARRIIGRLQGAGLVRTYMGVDGGTSLDCDPSTVTLLDVYRATNQGHLLPMHPATPNPDCTTGAHIQPALGSVYRRAQAALEAELSRTTIAHLAAEIRSRAAATS